MSYFAHTSAVIDEGCEIGEGTKIWHFCHVMAAAQIGKNCVIGQNVFIGNKVQIGDNVKVQNNVSLYEGVICEEEVFIGPSVVFTNVMNPRSMVERKNEFRTTLIKKGASLGANATIICGNEIGKYAFIAAAAVVTHPVPDYALVMGNPARQKGWVSELGHLLHFDEHDIATCPQDGKKYRLIEGTVRRLV